MDKKINKFIYWTPRILAIIFVAFLGLMSLDVFGNGLSFWETAIALFMHNVPALILLTLLIISWKHESVGAVTFILAGLLYTGLLLWTMASNGFQWYYLVWALQISGVAFLVGILFLVNWFKKKQ
jgi:hypothetical protein